MKPITWRIHPSDAASDTDAVHTVTYTLSRLRGRMTVTVDGEAFTLPAGLFGLSSARREPFRLVSPAGEAEQAILIVDKRGRATLLFRAKVVQPTES